MQQILATVIMFCLETRFGISVDMHKCIVDFSYSAQSKKIGICFRNRHKYPLWVGEGGCF